MVPEANNTTNSCATAGRSKAVAGVYRSNMIKIGMSTL
jgi:hypothetical protein